MENYMLPLAGADEVGASAYFVNIDGVKILFDAGARTGGSLKFPDYVILKEVLGGYDGLDYIILSHAHYDHIGSLAFIGSCAPKACILATPQTKALTALQLLDGGQIGCEGESDVLLQAKYSQAESVMNRILEQPVCLPHKTNRCEITFYPAGHMTGAVMTCVRTKNHCIFYTGDFSWETRSGINGIKLPGQLKPDLLILNATKAYRTEPKCGPDEDALTGKIQGLINKFPRVLIHSSGVAKQQELLDFMRQHDFNRPVYMDAQMETVGEALSCMGYPMGSPWMFGSASNLHVPHILLGTRGHKYGYASLNFDQYTLHATPSQLGLILKLLNPQKTLLTHTCPRGKGLPACVEPNDHLIIQAENGRIYNF